MNVRAWSITDQGNIRDNNEDSFLVDIDHQVFAVADGVGGGDDGELASKMLTDGLAQAAHDLAKIAAESDPIENREHREVVFQALLETIEKLNADIYEKGHAKRTLHPMATTCDAVLLSGASAFIAHVGDSRVYLLRDDNIFRITEDHTYAEELAARNIQDQDMLNRYKHVLSRSIGGKPNVEIDAVFIDLQPGDRIFICSDGVTDHIPGKELGRLGLENSEQDFLEAIVDLAKERGGKDNITAVLVEVSEGMRDTVKHVPRFDTMRQVDLMGNVALFKGLDVQQLLKMMRIVEQTQHQSSDQIVAQGSEFDACYIVADGSVELRVDDEVVKTVHAGEHFGDIALVSDQPSPYSAVCSKSTRLFVVQNTRFREIVSRDADIGTVLLWNLLKSSAQEILRLSAALSDQDDA